MSACLLVRFTPILKMTNDRRFSTFFLYETESNLRNLKNNQENNIKRKLVCYLKKKTGIREYKGYKLQNIIYRLSKRMYTHFD